MPLFPLHVVLFPGAAMPLHVFEPRYRTMMERVLGDDRRFGVVAIRRGREVGGHAETFRIGTMATVEQIQRSEDGSMAIVVAGRERFAIDVRLPDDPFPQADISVLDEEPGEQPDRELPGARAAVNRYLSVVARIHGDDVVAPTLPDDAIAASFTLAAALGLDLPDRQSLLEAPDAAARLRMCSDMAKREAMLLEAVGPSVGRPTDSYSPN
ncbi:MAG: LON peptidase substrate-binding domain-containing protein [Actinomycetota bacterium]